MLRKLLIFHLFYCFFVVSSFPCSANEFSYENEPVAVENAFDEAPLTEKSPPSLHVLIATVGRATLLRMLQSLQPQLEPQDYLTVVFDARDDADVYFLAEDFLKEFKCTCSIWMEPVNTGFWGHVIHNKYNELPGDFILHADDDDIYTSDAMDAIRHYCIDSDTLYIFRMKYSDGRPTLWHRHSIEEGEIGKPMGAIPSKYNSKGVWGYHYAGDFEFYNSLQAIIPKIEFVDHIIYSVRPN